MGHVYIVGMGPGSESLVTKEAWTALKKAQVLVGHKSQLERFAAGKKKFILSHNYDKALAYIDEQRAKQTIAVLVSGDPGIFSFTKKVVARLRRDEYTIIPGISSVQLACARLGISWEDIAIFSVHGRDKKGLVELIQKHNNVCILNDPIATPQILAKYLFDKGIKRRKVFTAENLSYKDEEIIETTIEELKDVKKEWKSLCLMIVI